MKNNHLRLVANEEQEKKTQKLANTLRRHEMIKARDVLEHCISDLRPFQREQAIHFALMGLRVSLESIVKTLETL